MPIKNIFLNLFVFVFFLLFLETEVFSQNYKVENFTWERRAVIHLSDTTPDWEVELQNREAPVPGGNSYREQLLLMKKQMREKYPVKINGEQPVYFKTDSLFPVILGRNFEGNIATNSIPNDNDIAISNGGIVMSVINSRVLVYDTGKDSALQVKTLGSYTSGLGANGSKFDPKVIYDPEADRFILIFLNGSTYQQSKIIVCYSQTNDPSGAWNAYALNGNPLNNNTWSDYPVVGISNRDLFIGINTFTNGSTNNSGFTETCLWQISNEDGYAGNTLTTKYYHDIFLANGIRPIFNICPIQGGSGLYGPDMYLLSNRATSYENDSVFLLHVNNHVKSNPTLQIKFLRSDKKYLLPPEARQQGTHTFDTNDNRVLGGFYENNVIQFVQSCRNPSTGLAGIYHGFIENPGSLNPNVRANIIGDTLLDYGYPNISYSGRDPRDSEAIITFNHTSPVDFAGFSFLYYSNKGEYSQTVKIKTGENYVDAFNNGDYERWGDYSGSQRKYNETGTVWAVGSWGKLDKKNGTWIAELTSTDSIRPPLPPSPDVARFFPNPVREYVTLNFYMEKTASITVDIYDMNGKKIISLFNDMAKFGQNILTFSTAPLATGIYFAVITSEEKFIYREKIVKAAK